MPKNCPEWIPPGDGAGKKTVVEPHVNIEIIECPHSDEKRVDPRNEFARRTGLPVTSKKKTSYHEGGEQD